VPGEPRALSNRSACHAALGRYADALSDADAAAAVQPSFGKAHSRRGLALWHLGRFHESAEAYQAALSLDGANADARAVRAETGCSTWRNRTRPARCRPADARARSVAVLRLHRAWSAR
jgi:tetratricopeptide (TPR) repeat protein